MLASPVVSSNYDGAAAEAATMLASADAVKTALAAVVAAKKERSTGNPSAKDADFN